MAYRRTPQERARLEAVRERIIDATVRLVAGGGWSAATVAAVAAEAGVATGTVYRHVADKEQLLAEAFRRAAGRELTRVASAADSRSSAPDRIEAALRTFAARALRGRRLAYALLAEPAGTAIETERLAYRAEYHELFAGVLRAGIDDHELPPHDAVLVAAVLVGAMGEALVGPVAPVGARDDRTTARRTDEFVAVCLRALPRPRSTAARPEPSRFP